MGSGVHDLSVSVSQSRIEDLERDVYCVLGLPIDVVDIPAAVHLIDSAAVRGAPFLISTPNLNFLVNSRVDPEFRESILDSDLCPADGMPIVWIARLIGVPVGRRASGSDIFDALKTSNRHSRRLKFFLFGGPDGVAAAAARAINAELSGVTCVGALAPGFGSIDEMSRDETINEVNASGADFLAASLGAKKGQLWLYRNRQRLTIPIRAHLGATINFQAGTVRRAPSWLRACGLEWLWRIKEEPHLWSRYAYDGWMLLRLVPTRVLPLAIANQWYRFKCRRSPKNLKVKIEQNQDFATISLSGDANERHTERAIACFRETLTARTQSVVFDLTGTRVIDSRFFGLLLMLRKHLKERGATLTFVGVPAAVRRMFRLNELDFLLKGQ